MVGLTETIAQWRDVPEIGLDPEEAKELMGATQNVLRHYSIETTQKGADFIALFGVFSMIVGTRIGAYNIRVRAERDAGNVQRPKPTVVRPQQFQQGPQQPPQPPQPMTPRPEPQFSDGDGSGF